MPYLRLYTPDFPVEKKREMARALTETILDTLHIGEDGRNRCTIHFTPFQLEDVAIGGRLMLDMNHPNYHLELTDHDLSQEQKYALVTALTTEMLKQLGLAETELYRINIKFNDYKPADFAIGGVFQGEIQVSSQHEASGAVPLIVE